MLADKLSTYKILAELESLDGGHTDLAGDSGTESVARLPCHSTVIA
jgi:hypothetical protein